MTVDHCSLWPEGVWAHCCAAHDASPLDVASAIELGRCVAATGHTVMGIAMTAGVIVFGPLYLWIQRRRRLPRAHPLIKGSHDAR